MGEPPYRNWIEMFMTLGRPAGNGEAFFDMDPDDILFSNSNVHLTVWDVRELQMATPTGTAE